MGTIDLLIICVTVYLVLGDYMKAVAALTYQKARELRIENDHNEYEEREHEEDFSSY